MKFQLKQADQLAELINQSYYAKVIKKKKLSLFHLSTERGQNPQKKLKSVMIVMSVMNTMLVMKIMTKALMKKNIVKMKL